MLWEGCDQIDWLRFSLSRLIVGKVREDFPEPGREVYERKAGTPRIESLDLMDHQRPKIPLNARRWLRIPSPRPPT